MRRACLYGAARLSHHEYTDVCQLMSSAGEWPGCSGRDVRAHRLDASLPASNSAGGSDGALEGQRRDYCASAALLCSKFLGLRTRHAALAAALSSTCRRPAGLWASHSLTTPPLMPSCTLQTLLSVTS